MGTMTIHLGEIDRLLFSMKRKAAYRETLRHHFRRNIRLLFPYEGDIMQGISA
jgi:hypothetical protein